MNELNFNHPGFLKSHKINMKVCDLACEESTPLHMPELTMGCDARNMARMTSNHQFLVMVKGMTGHDIPYQ